MRSSPNEMDMDFMRKLEQLKAACASADPDYIAYLNETIESLQRMRDNFKHDEQDSSGVLTSRLLEINKELEAMGGEQSWHAMYKSIPQGCIPAPQYWSQVAAFQSEIAGLETAMQHVPAGYNLEGMQDKCDGLKTRLMLYLEHSKPFETVPYLAKKRQLLDEKLALLKDLRKIKA